MVDITIPELPLKALLVGTELIEISDAGVSKSALISNMQLIAQKGAVNGYAGLDASAQLLLVNFPAGTALQILRRNAGNTALEFADISTAALTSLNADTTSAQIIAAGTGLGLVDAGATHTLSIDATVATLIGAQALTNKTIDGDLNTILDINETQMNVSVGASGQILTSNGVGLAPTYQPLATGEFFGPWTANHNANTFNLVNLAGVLDVNVLPVLLFATVGASALNQITITNAITGLGPIISTTGANVDIDLNLSPKGVGNVNINSDIDMVSNNILQTVASVSSVGFIRMLNTTVQGWRNVGNTNDLTFGVNASDNFVMTFSGINEFTFSSTFLDINAKALKRATAITDASDLDILSFVTVGALAINSIQITNSLTGLGPRLESVGGNVNVDLNITAKGTGVINTIDTDLNLGTAFLRVGEIALPVNSTLNTGILYVRDLVGITTLFFQDGSGTETNLLAVGGTGDVVGPASSTDNALVSFSGGTGKLIKESTVPVILSVNGEPTWPRSIQFTSFSAAPAGTIGYIVNLTNEMYYNGFVGHRWFVNNVEEMSMTATELDTNTLNLIQGAAYHQMDAIVGPASTGLATRGRIYLDVGNANHLSVQRNGVVVDLEAAVTDSPWTIDHDIDRFDLDDSGVLFFGLPGPRTVPADFAQPFIYFEAGGTPDQIRLNVPATNEFGIYVNGVESYSFSASIFDLLGSQIQNASTVTLESLTGGVSLIVENTDLTPITGDIAGNIVFRGQRVTPSVFDFGRIQVEQFDVSGASADGEMKLMVGEANVENVEYVTLNEAGLALINFKKDVAALGDVIMTGRLQGAKGADVASAATITLVDGNLFDVTGVTQIDAMTSTGWQAGSIVVLHFDGALTVTHNTGADGFFLAGAASFVTTADDTLTVVWNGTRWEEISRSVN